jgi:hypothetical protein
VVDVIFTRAKTAEDIQPIHQRVMELNNHRARDDHPIRIETLLYAPESYVNAGAIAAASPFMAALVMSHTVAGDLGVARKLGESLWERNALRLQRAQALVAAREAGIQLIDHVITMRMGDEANIRQAARGARDAGADGVRALTPMQAKIIAEVFSEEGPSTDALAVAHAIMSQAAREGWTIPSDVAEHDTAPNGIEVALGIVERFQHAQLRGIGGIVHDPQGAAEWIDPYSARHFMRRLDAVRHAGRLTAEQHTRFERIEHLYGADWREQRLLQVPLEAVREQAVADVRAHAAAAMEESALQRLAGWLAAIDEPEVRKLHSDLTARLALQEAARHLQQHVTEALGPLQSTVPGVSIVVEPVSAATRFVEDDPARDRPGNDDEFVLQKFAFEQRYFLIELGPCRARRGNDHDTSETLGQQLGRHDRVVLGLHERVHS